ncbi:MAG: large conductance mechanosensitive channel protein MscL [Lachnospiraceae bacterium]|nr:large conductance mechanosensitive channel protein MscL [Lachnospiraceae bacterium]
MKKFLQEFKEFALKGNVMDLAIGVIIGGAFSAIVTALTDSFINPLINSIGGAEIAGMIRLPWVDYSGMTLEEISALSLNYGAFITAIINFLIIALILFILVKAMNKVMSIGKKKEEEEPTEKECPYCKMMIAIGATRCPHCTSEIKE